MKELLEFCKNEGKIIIIKRDHNIMEVNYLCKTYYEFTMKNEIVDLNE
jgi:hypothetical protein